MLSQIPLHLAASMSAPTAPLWGETNATEAVGTGKLGVGSSFILCCISAGPGLRSGRGRIMKLNESPEKFSLPPAWVGGNERQSPAFAKRLLTLFQYIYLCLLFLFFTCNF